MEPQFDFLMSYAQSIVDQKPLKWASPSDYPEDIANLLYQLQEGAELNEEKKKSFKDAFDQWEEEGFLVDTVDYDDDEFLSEGGSPDPSSDVPASSE